MGLWRCRIDADEKDFFLKKEAKTFILVFLVFAGASSLAFADENGRDFPKTLIFDEPGIDDEISLPTLIVTPQNGGSETDVDFELDKRLTTRLSLQINIGYSQLPREAGWQDSTATLKFVAYSDRAAEQLVSLSLIREFGGSGASRIGASPNGSTTGAINFGQGFAEISEVPGLKPFAVTGSVGYLVPDEQAPGEMQQALLSASLQYSFDVLSQSLQGRHLPHFLQLFLPIVECSFALPTHGGGQKELLSPGLIYAGDGFQLAAEALIPLSRASGTHAGFIAQLNISLETLGVPALARPLL